MAGRTAARTALESSWRNSRGNGLTPSTCRRAGLTTPCSAAFFAAGFLVAAFFELFALDFFAVEVLALAEVLIWLLDAAFELAFFFPVDFLGRAGDLGFDDVLGLDFGAAIAASRRLD